MINERLVRREKARVFISCGQGSEREREVAQSISALVTSLGFDAYVAVHETTLEGLTSNIYRRIEDCDFFLFIDFRRRRQKPDYSLFSHQELAIASFLGKRFLGFQEKGRRLNGILSFLQANLQPFSNDEDLLAKISSSLTTPDGANQTWFPDEREVYFRLPEEFAGDRAQRPDGQRAYYLFVEVVNGSRSRSLRNCSVYLSAIRDANGTSIYGLEPMPIKWTGLRSEAVHIPPMMSRRFDALVAPYRQAPADTIQSAYPCIQTDAGAFLRAVTLAVGATYEMDFMLASTSTGGNTVTIRVAVPELVDELRLELIHQ